jgi:hypothetical protein
MKKIFVTCSCGHKTEMVTTHLIKVCPSCKRSLNPNGGALERFANAMERRK